MRTLSPLAESPHVISVPVHSNLFQNVVVVMSLFLVFCSVWFPNPSSYFRMLKNFKCQVTSRSSKNVKNLPVTYMNQTNEWMTDNLFIDWYDKTFIPKVKNYRENIWKFGEKIAYCRQCIPPSQWTFRRENGKFSVMYQGITKTIRKLYRK
jgi:hypothetical protein